MSSHIDDVKFNFLYIDIYRFGRTWVYPESMLPYNMLRYITKGSASFFVNGREYVVRQGDMVYLSKGSSLSCHAREEDFEFYSIRFITSIDFGRGDILTDYFKVETVNSGLGSDCLNYFKQIYYWIKSEDPARMFRVRGYLDLLISMLISCQNGERAIDREETATECYTLEQLRFREQKSNVKADPRIQVVVNYLLLHPSENISIKQMSQMAGLSETRFRTLFREQVGKRPLEYLNELRAMKAARLLLTSSKNVSDIAYDIGFNDVNYFIRVFKKYFCVTPRQYREQMKE